MGSFELKIARRRNRGDRAWDRKRSLGLGLFTCRRGRGGCRGQCRWMQICSSYLLLSEWISCKSRLLALLLRSGATCDEEAHEEQKQTLSMPILHQIFRSFGMVHSGKLKCMDWFPPGWRQVMSFGDHHTITIVKGQGRSRESCITPKILIFACTACRLWDVFF